MFKTIILWRKLGKYSQVHKNRLSEIKHQCRYIFNTSKSLDENRWIKVGLRTNSKKQNILGKKKKNNNVLALFYFWFKISKNIEVVSDGVHIRCYFPRKPACYFLSSHMRTLYRDICSIEDSNKKMTEIMKGFELFSLVMEADLRNFRQREKIFRLTSRDNFHLYQVILWHISLLINILLAFDLIIKDGTTKSKGGSLHIAIVFFDWLLMILSAINLTTWTVLQRQQNKIEHEARFKIKYPHSDFTTFWCQFRIFVLDSFLKQGMVISMITHIIASIMS